nr:hypothetical protein [Tanacetum cinerariifolium]GEY39662.1 hypothetical protein [Tanacetum cinerariifolium]
MKYVDMSMEANHVIEPVVQIGVPKPGETEIESQILTAFEPMDVEVVLNPTVATIDEEFTNTMIGVKRSSTNNSTAIDLNKGTKVGKDPTIPKTRNYNKSYYQRRKEQINFQGGLYDFVYNGIPKEHNRLKEQPPCVHCGAKNIKDSGVYTFRVQGGIYHRIDQLVPRDGEPREIVTILSRVLAQNPYVQTFRSLGNLGPLDKYRVELTASVKDAQRLYNRPKTSQVAGIWVEGNENITTYKRSIVVYENMNTLRIYNLISLAMILCFIQCSFQTRRLDGIREYQRKV